MIYKIRKGFLGIPKLEAENKGTRHTFNKSATGEHFKIKPTKTGFYVLNEGQQISDELFTELRFNNGDSYFVASRENEHVLFNTDNGEKIELSALPSSKFVVDKKGKVHLIEVGHFYKRDIDGRALLKYGKPVEIDFHLDNFIFVVDKYDNVKAINKIGHVVIPNVTNCLNPEIKPVQASFPTESDVCFIIKDLHKNVIMTEAGVIYEAPLDKEITACSFGNSYAFGTYDSKTDTSSVRYYDEHSRRIFNMNIRGKIEKMLNFRPNELVFKIVFADGTRESYTCYEGKRLFAMPKTGAKGLQVSPIKIPRHAQVISEIHESGPNSAEATISLKKKGSDSSDMGSGGFNFE